MLVVGLADGCSSTDPKPQATSNTSDVNKTHWDGTTGVLKRYRMPENTVGKSGKTSGVAKRDNERKEDQQK